MYKLLVIFFVIREKIFFTSVMRWLSHDYLVQYGQYLSFSPILLLFRSPIYWSYYTQDRVINNAYWLILISYIEWKSIFEYALLVLFLCTASIIFCQNTNLCRPLCRICVDSFWRCSNKLKDLYLFSTSFVIKICVVVIWCLVFSTPRFFLA